MRTPRGVRTPRPSRGSRALLPAAAALVALGLVLGARRLAPRPPAAAAAALPGRCSAAVGDEPLEAAAKAGWAARRALYFELGKALRREADLAGAGAAQGRNLFRSGSREQRPTPLLEALDVPVRAVVLPVRDEAACARIAAATRVALAPLERRGGSVWYQDENVLHASLFHASHHLDQKPATSADVQAEGDAVAGAARRLCPVRAVLERVVVTPSGVMLAGWNVRSGAQPAALRGALRDALPRGPAKQIVADAHIVHTTLARVVDVPAGAAALLLDAADALTQKLCGLETTADRLWYVLEHDALALALRGRYDSRDAPLQCEQ